ncbi:HAD family hydrolase [Corynebacterium hansenii]|uniref:HAD family hydrolase n=1 Tax=Corynebacterium hansenii TaxID=394964 RepID=A0ABV7ZMR3_9CORY|nr:HAD family hydrolase [Corynebacterium hansenii]WJY99598.1 haloacid dehalogenase-like hydrolase [Corynebacterium hansenii]
MLVIWDIDLTLIDNAGFGHAEADRLLAERGIERPADLTFAGRTDADIWGSVLGAQPGDAVLGDFLTDLADACAVAEWRGSVLPGVRAVVSALARSGHSQTVVSGNMAETGWLKLRHAHLSEFMAPRFSAFGDYEVDRSELLRVALMEWGGRGPVVAVGDTPADAAAALENGIGFVGVTTGRHTASDLTAAMVNVNRLATPYFTDDDLPDGTAIVEDLRDAPAVVKLLESMAR